MVGRAYRPARTMREMHDEPALAPSPRPTRGMLVASFVAVVLGGLLGAIIGAGLVGVGCTGSCSTATGTAIVVGGLAGAGGVGIVVALVLRARAEWRRISR